MFLHNTGAHADKFHFLSLRIKIEVNSPQIRHFCVALRNQAEPSSIRGIRRRKDPNGDGQSLQNNKHRSDKKAIFTGVCSPDWMEAQSASTAPPSLQQHLKKRNKKEKEKPWPILPSRRSKERCGPSRTAGCDVDEVYSNGCSCDSRWRKVSGGGGAHRGLERRSGSSEPAALTVWHQRGAFL